MRLLHFLLQTLFCEQTSETYSLLTANEISGKTLTWKLRAATILMQTLIPLD